MGQGAKRRRPTNARETEPSDFLDVKRAGPATTLRFFRLEHTRAESIVPMLRQILLSRIIEDVPDAGANMESLLEVSADRKTNTLIISAPQSILPVAEQLKNKPNQMIAERYEAATVLFADLSGFTPLSRQMDASEIIDLLNAIFTRFDEAGTRTGKEKIR